MPVIYTSIALLITMSGNYSQFVPGPPVNPVLGSWWLDVESPGPESELVWKFFDGADWIPKRIVLQD